MAISNEQFNGKCTFPQCMCIDIDHCRYKPDMPVGFAGVPTKPQREGDQAPPKPNELPAIQDLVMKDLAERKAIGIKRYGTALQPHNGRDALLDAYEEAQDLCMYLRQAIYERDGK